MDEAQAQGVSVCSRSPLPGAAEPHPPHEQQPERLPGEVQRRHPGPGHKVEAEEHLRSATAVRSIPAAPQRRGRMPFAGARCARRCLIQ